jgi:tRNA modification GTPase
VEAEGVRRSRAALGKAELVLHVLDASGPLTEDDRSLLAEASGRPRVIVLNKADLPAVLRLPEGLTGVATSCSSGDGIEAVKDAIEGAVWSGRLASVPSQITVNARHADALRRAQGSIQRAAAELRGGSSLELVAIDLRLAADAVGEIVGKTTTDDLLDAIFSQFCLGK